MLELETFKFHFLIYIDFQISNNLLFDDIIEVYMSPRNTKQYASMRADATKKIEEAAMKTFSIYGFHASTIKLIATESGLSYGLVYHYFKSKEALFIHLVDKSLLKSRETITKGLEIEGTAWDKLENLSKTLIAELNKSEAFKYFFIILQAMTQGKSIPDLVRNIEEKAKFHYEAIIPIILEAQKEGNVSKEDPGILAGVFYSLFQGLSIMAFQEPNLLKHISHSYLLKVFK